MQQVTMFSMFILLIKYLHVTILNYEILSRGQKYRTITMITKKIVSNLLKSCLYVK